MVEAVLASFATSAGTAAAATAAGSAIGPVTAAASGLGTLSTIASTGFTLLQGFGAVGGILGQISAGQSASAAYKQQANQELLNSRLETVKAEDQANSIRRTLLANIGSSNAMFAARGIGLGSGTPEQAKTVGADNASKNIDKARFGGDMASLDRIVQSGQSRLDAKAARTSGYANAATSFVQNRSAISSLINL